MKTTDIDLIAFNDGERKLMAAALSEDKTEQWYSDGFPYKGAGLPISKALAERFPDLFPTERDAERWFAFTHFRCMHFGQNLAGMPYPSIPGQAEDDVDREAQRVASTGRVRLFVKEEGRASGKECELQLLSTERRSGRTPWSVGEVCFEVVADDVFTNVVYAAECADRPLTFGLLMPDGDRFLMSGLTHTEVSSHVGIEFIRARVNLRMTKKPIEIPATA
jgi:hypothetical protein